jgi:hypothetical protein
MNKEKQIKKLKEQNKFLNSIIKAFRDIRKGKIVKYDSSNYN